MYKKWISYVYEYQHGKKGKNAGFIRLELHNTIYNMQIQLKQMKQDQMWEVYGFYGKKEEMQLKNLGGMDTKDGCGTALFTGEANQIHTEKGQLLGGFLVVPENAVGMPECFYVSQWDDEKIQWAALAVWRQYFQIEEPVPQLQIAELVVPQKMEEQTVCTQCAEEAKVSGETQNTQMPQGEEEREENRQKEEIQREEIKREPVPMEVAYEPEPPKEQSQEEKEPERQWLKPDAGVERKTQEWEASTPPAHNREWLQENVEGDTSWSRFTQRREQLHAAFEQWKNSEEEDNSWEAGERFLERFPVLNPFYDAKVLKSVRMEPKDLGVFPIEFWYLANNSFLLHGYYCYRHLLFMKLKNQKEYQYGIGVPGNYNRQEKFMANMFGFSHFKEVKTEEKEGFGYWWIRLR